MVNEEFERDIQKLKMLLSVKNEFEKQLNFQASLYLKRDKVNKIFDDLDYVPLGDNCDLEIDMRRTLSIIDKLNSKIDDLLEEYDICIKDNDEYAEFILKHEYCIE